jgi:uncharacterized protein (DUF3084 family)
MNSLLLAAMFVAYLFLATGVVLGWLFQRAESERQKTELGQIQEQWDTARKDRSFHRSDLRKWEQESDRVELCMCQEDLDRL